MFKLPQQKMEFFGHRKNGIKNEAQRERDREREREIVMGGRGERKWKISFKIEQH